MINGGMEIETIFVSVDLKPEFMKDFLILQS